MLAVQMAICIGELVYGHLGNLPMDDAEEPLLDKVCCTLQDPVSYIHRISYKYVAGVLQTAIAGSAAVCGAGLAQGAYVLTHVARLHLG